MATWNRGRHILPSVRSVLNQSHRDFELLVVGDEVTDDTAEHLARISDPRLRWIDNAPRWGTQSGPNNRGIVAARAPFVAYIGHDDIWAPNHLEAMWDVRRAQPEADVIVSGLVSHRLNAARPYRVSGLLAPGLGLEILCFVPPTATSHRVEIVRNVPWSRKEDAVVAIDFDHQLELARAGASFAATGRITAHKFTSAGRYLSYFDPESVEQEHMLTRFDDPDYPAWLARIVARARETGDFMPEETRSSDREETRKRIARVARARGVEGLPANLPVGDGISLLQGDDPRFADWRPLKPESGYRMAGPNPNPRLLVPLTSAEPVELRLRLRSRRPDLLPAMRIRLNGMPIAHRIEQRSVGPQATFADLVLRGGLRPDRASVLVLEQFGDDIRSGRADRVLAAGALTAVPRRLL